MSSFGSQLLQAVLPFHGQVLSKQAPRLAQALGVYGDAGAAQVDRQPRQGTPTPAPTPPANAQPGQVYPAGNEQPTVPSTWQDKAVTRTPGAAPRAGGGTSQQGSFAGPLGDIPNPLANQQNPSTYMGVLGVPTDKGVPYLSGGQYGAVYDSSNNFLRWAQPTGASNMLSEGLYGDLREFAANRAPLDFGALFNDPAGRIGFRRQEGQTLGNLNSMLDKYGGGRGSPWSPADAAAMENQLREIDPALADRFASEINAPAYPRLGEGESLLQIPVGTLADYQRLGLGDFAPVLAQLPPDFDTIPGTGTITPGTGDPIEDFLNSSPLALNLIMQGLGGGNFRNNTGGASNDLLTAIMGLIQPGSQVVSQGDDRPLNQQPTMTTAQMY